MTQSNGKEGRSSKKQTSRKGEYQRIDTREASPPVLVNGLALSEQTAALLREGAREAAGHRLRSGPDSPLARLIGAFVEETLKAEMQEHLGYDPHARRAQEESTELQSPRRSNTRNGYSDKRLKTSFGETSIKLPRDRSSEFEPLIVPKYGSLSEEISERIIGMYGGGMTTAEIAEHVRGLYQIEVSKSLVSRVVESIEPDLQAWRQRPLQEIAPILYLDGIHLKIRQQGRIRSTAVYLASAYTEEGQLEVIGVWIAPEDFGTGQGESSSYWFEAMQELKNRGLREVLIACVDGLAGLPEAICAVWSTVEVLPCVVHLVRSTLRHVPQTRRRAVAQSLRLIYRAPSYEAAHTALSEAHRQWDSRYATALKRWDTALEALRPLWGYSDALRTVVYTTNPQENINRQIRKVTKNRGMFPSTESALRLVTMVLQRINARNHQRGVRPDWASILEDLHRTFGKRLPDEWGFRVRQ